MNSLKMQLQAYKGVVVHYLVMLGNGFNNQVARKYSLVIEDAAKQLCLNIEINIWKYRNIGCFSFHETKILTESGAILINNQFFGALKL